MSEGASARRPHAWFCALAAGLAVGAWVGGQSLSKRGHREEVDAMAARAEAARVRSIALEAVAGERGRQEGELRARLDDLQIEVAGLEAAGRLREADLLAARADLERTRRALEGAEDSRAEAERKAALLREALDGIRGSGAGGIEEVARDVPAAASLQDPATGGSKGPPPTEAGTRSLPPPGLGPTAVTDAKQVAKIVEGLNALLAGVPGKETFRVTAAEAVDGDRLVRATLEARGMDGDVSKSFEAQEARFVLAASTGTLAIRLWRGTVIYRGNRRVPFPGERYDALLTVETSPFRTSGNPLISVQ